MIRFDKKTISGIAVFAVFVSAVLYGLFPLGLHRYFTDRSLLTAVITEHRTNSAFIFIGLQILQVVAAPLPGEVTGFVGGVFFGTALGILYSTIGLTAGSWLAFSLARLSGRPLVEKIAAPETIRRYDYVMKHRGLFLAFLMFLIPGFPKDILCYILGLGHMSHRNFLIVSTTGRLFGTTLLTLGGEFFRDRHYAAFFTVLGIGLALFLFVLVKRESIERGFRRLRTVQLMKTRSERIRNRDNQPR